MIDKKEFDAMFKELNGITNQVIELNHRLIALSVRMHNFSEQEK
jgi:hypothetical protein